MQEHWILKASDLCKEYFCTDCLQLRASFIPNPIFCKNCNSKNIIVGEPYSLDKEKLLKKYKGESNNVKHNQTCDN